MNKGSSLNLRKRTLELACFRTCRRNLQDKSMVSSDTLYNLSAPFWNLMAASMAQQTSCNYFHFENSTPCWDYICSGCVFGIKTTLFLHSPLFPINNLSFATQS
jgi:hypothetical protein